MIQIDKNVPPPKPGKTGRKARYPWASMKPGDSFFAPGFVSNTKSKEKTGLKIICTTYGRQVIPGSTWSVDSRTENGVLGVRVWRLT